MGREGIPNAQSKKGDPKKLTPGMWTTSDHDPRNRHHIQYNKKKKLQEKFRLHCN